jgi:hypothetical protein
VGTVKKIVAAKPKKAKTPKLKVGKVRTSKPKIGVKKPKKGGLAMPFPTSLDKLKKEM